MIIVKIGGSIVDRIPELIDVLNPIIDNIVIVHGGAGKVTNKLASQLGTPSRWVVHPSGMKSRYTDSAMIDIYTMAVCKANKNICFEFSRRGHRVIGLTGVDGDLLKARRKEKIRIVEDGKESFLEGDYTGMLRTANVDLINLLIANNYIPIIAPLAMSFDREPLNVDGDRVAGFLANKLNAEKVVSITDVPGVLDENKNVVQNIKRQNLDEWITKVGSGVGTGGMKRKLFAAKEALANGTKEFHICSINNFMKGTVIK